MPALFFSLPIAASGIPMASVQGATPHGLMSEPITEDHGFTHTDDPHTSIKVSFSL
jgi:hypothetical protein